MDPHKIKLRRQLAEIGLEKTPAEIDDLLVDIQRFAGLIDEDLYRWLKPMTPGRILVEAWSRRIPLKEFMEIRDVIIKVYERVHGNETF